MPLFGKKKSNTSVVKGNENYKSNLKTKGTDKRGKVMITEIQGPERIGKSAFSMPAKATRTVIKDKTKNGVTTKTVKTKTIPMRRAERIVRRGM